MAERFEVSKRTIYRDLSTLEQSGIPIGAENGIGFYLVEGYHLPPVAFTEEEANTLIVVEQLVRTQGDTSIRTNFNTLLLKIKAALKAAQKENLEVLNQRTTAFTKAGIPDSNSLSAIHNAILKKVVLSIEYHSASKQETTQRNIRPVGVYFTNHTWVVVAFCELRQGLREFRLDRIKQIDATEHQFKEPSDFNLDKYFKAIATSN